MSEDKDLRAEWSAAIDREDWDRATDIALERRARDTMTQDNAREVRLSEAERAEIRGIAEERGDWRIIALLDALDAAKAREADAEQRGKKAASTLRRILATHGHGDGWRNPVRAVADRIAGQTGDGR